MLRGSEHARPVPARPSPPLTAGTDLRSIRIVLATCQAKPGLTASDALLAGELERAGAAVIAAPWDAIASTDAEGAVVCLRSTWDYHRRWSEFRAWIGGFAGRRGGLWNPAETVLWNADKQYLRDLGEAGIALPQHALVRAGRSPGLCGHPPRSGV